MSFEWTTFFNSSAFQLGCLVTLAAFLARFLYQTSRLAKVESQNTNLHNTLVQMKEVLKQKVQTLEGLAELGRATGGGLVSSNTSEEFLQIGGTFDEPVFMIDYKALLTIKNDEIDTLQSQITMLEDMVEQLKKDGEHHIELAVDKMNHTQREYDMLSARHKFLKEDQSGLQKNKEELIKENKHLKTMIEAGKHINLSQDSDELIVNIGQLTQTWLENGVAQKEEFKHFKDSLDQARKDLYTIEQNHKSQSPSN